MIEWSQLTSDEIAQLDKRLPVLLPIGLIEAHGPHLALSVDSDTANYFSRAVAERSGAILAPLLPYGFADEMAEYPGTIGLSVDTAIAVFDDLVSHFCRHGFTRVITLSGHGANKTAFEVAVQRIWAKFPDARIAYWNYWTEAGYDKVSHADKVETEIALSVGTRSRMDQVRDFSVKKPWYRLRSRHAIEPKSGGINGKPSEANIDEGIRVRDDIVHILSERITKIIAAERGTL